MTVKHRDSLTGYEKYEEELWLYDDVPELDLDIGYKVNALLHYEQSPYQEISVIENKGFGRMLVLDGTPQYTTNDGFIYNEMIAHVPLITHPAPKKVAIIGGGNCGPAREAVKYPEVEQVDVVEIDKRVVEVCRTWFSADVDSLGGRVNLVHRDGAEWIQEQKGAYDVLIVDRSDPYGPATVLYKPTFYQDAYHCLREDGIAVFQSGSPYYYAHILRDTVRNLGKLFPVVRTYLAAVPTFPGGIWSFTLASKKWDPLQADVNRLQWQDARYINPETLRASFALPNYVRERLK
jgi:spermidine synthase